MYSRYNIFQAVLSDVQKEKKKSNYLYLFLKLNLSIELPFYLMSEPII